MPVTHLGGSANGVGRLSARRPRRIARHAARKKIPFGSVAADTLLHIAAEAYRPLLGKRLIALGADACARNRRGAKPLHYAVDGVPGSRNLGSIGPGGEGDLPRGRRRRSERCRPQWDDPAASRRAEPLAAAVRALLAGGADVHRANQRRSMPLELTTWTPGRGGSGSPTTSAQQQEIVRLLKQHGAAGASQGLR